MSKFLIPSASFLLGAFLSAVLLFQMADDAVKVAEFRSDYTYSLMREVLDENPETRMGDFPLIWGMKGFEPFAPEKYSEALGKFCETELTFPSLAYWCQQGLWRTPSFGG